ncbi:MAG: hypothetical protein WAO01_04620, partial [Bradyrhizobium sp.]
NIPKIPQEKRGAAGITTAAPHIAGQWGRGDNRLRKRRAGGKIVPAKDYFFRIIFTVTAKSRNLSGFDGVNDRQ